MSRTTNRNPTTIEITLYVYMLPIVFGLLFEIKNRKERRRKKFPVRKKRANINILLRKKLALFYVEGERIVFLLWFLLSTGKKKRSFSAANMKKRINAYEREKEDRNGKRVKTMHSMLCLTQKNPFTFNNNNNHNQGELCVDVYGGGCATHHSIFCFFFIFLVQSCCVVPKVAIFNAIFNE